MRNKRYRWIISFVGFHSEGKDYNGCLLQETTRAIYTPKKLAELTENIKKQFGLSSAVILTATRLP